MLWAPRPPAVIRADAGIQRSLNQDCEGRSVVGEECCGEFRASRACKGGFETHPYVAFPSQSEGEVMIC